MEQKQVLKTLDRCIYRIKESNLDFYLIIPNNPRINLVLGLIDKANDESVSNLSKIQDKAVVIPVLDERILVGVKQNLADYFSYLDKYFSNILNLSHKILVHNRIQVLDMIYFYSSLEYQSFKEWFIGSHSGRVEGIELSFNTVEVVSASVSSDNLVTTPVMENNPFMETTNVDPVSVDVKKEEEVESIQTKEPGFVSYVLLGVIVAVLSLVFLYFII